MAHPCNCGAEAHYEPAVSTATGGICADCYKTLSAEERRRWIARKARSSI